MSKMLKYNGEARVALKNGIDKVADAVCGTLGPCGLNVVLDKGFGSPLITNDGVSIVKEIELENPYENMGAELIKEVATKTNNDGGDGTTTATILAREILNEGIKNISSGANGVFLKKGIDYAVNQVVDLLKNFSIEVKNDNEKIEQIATISSNSNEIGKLIADAMNKVSTDGVITLEDSKTNDTYTDIIDGMQFDKGVISPYFISDNPKNEKTIENPTVIIIDSNISNKEELKEVGVVLEKALALGKPLFLIASDYSKDAIQTLVYNRIMVGVDIYAVKAPGYGDNKKEQLRDIAVFTGAKVITNETGAKIKEATASMFGTAKKIIVNKDTTTIISNLTDTTELDERYNYIKEQYNKSTSDYDKTKLEERMAKLKGKIGVVYVGANTETEQKELKLRVEDALNATKAAVSEGIVAGGGRTLAKISTLMSSVMNEPVDLSNNDIETGYEIIKKALTKPLWQIAKNSGLNPELVVANIINADNDIDNYGIDAATGNYCDMVKAGIIDPVKVTRVALQNAASVASMILTANVVIATKPENDKDVKPSDFNGCSGCGGY